MARSHLTLAALATAAVPGFDVVAAQKFGSASRNDFDAAILTERQGRHWIVRVPRNAQAEAEQSADLVAIQALSNGVRTRLPFAVSRFAGQTAIDGTRAVVYEYVYGSKVPLHSMSLQLAASVGRAIAAIHSLPTSFIADAGLPSLTSTECLRTVVSTMDRAAATALVPAALLGRWERATEDSALWQFQPTVINGAITWESIVSAESEVTGVLGWQEMRIGDPARDLFWLMGAGGEDVAEAAVDAYTMVRGGGDRMLVQRARLYAELEIAKWLLHGTQTRSTEIVDDAVSMMHSLLDRVENDLMHPLGTQTMPSATVDEVEYLLVHTGQVS